MEEKERLAASAMKRPSGDSEDCSSVAGASGGAAAERPRSKRVSFDPSPPAAAAATREQPAEKEKKHKDPGDAPQKEPLKDKSSSVQVHPSAVVTSEAKVHGPGGVTIGEGTAVHPACTINAKVGPIQIGAFNIFEEQVMIVNESTSPLVIGDYNTFEVGTQMLDRATVGDLNVFGCRSSLGKGVVIASGCTVGPCVAIANEEELPDETVVVGRSGLRHSQPGAKIEHKEAATKHLEIVKDTLKLMHSLKK